MNSNGANLYNRVLSGKSKLYIWEKETERQRERERSMYANIFITKKGKNKILKVCLSLQIEILER